MSAGDFLYSRYQANNGNIHRIRIQPETLALTIGGTANAAPAGAVDTQGTVKISQGNRAFGVKPRNVTLKFTAAVPDGYSGDNVRVPLLTTALFDAATNGATGTYLGVPVEVVGKSAERVR